MSVDTIIIIAISAATLVATALGIVWGYKWHKAGLRQNLEIEHASIERELPSVEAQIMNVRQQGERMTSNILGIVPNPKEDEIRMLENKKNALLKRKAEIEKQLKQL